MTDGNWSSFNQMDTKGKKVKKKKKKKEGNVSQETNQELLWHLKNGSCPSTEDGGQEPRKKWLIRANGSDKEEEKLKKECCLVHDF